jgi:hypothetical protein
MFKNFKVDNARRVEFTGNNIQIPKSKWAYLRNNIDTFHTTGGEGTPSEQIPIVNISEWNKTVCGINRWDSAKMFADLKAVHDTGFMYEIKDGRNCIKVVAPNFTARNIKFYYGFKENTQYSFRFDVFNYLVNPAVAGIVFYVNYSDGSDVQLNSSLVNPETWKTITHTSTAGKTILNANIFYATGSNYSWFDLDSFAIYEGVGLYDYTPYQGNTYPYRLEDTDGVLHYGGDLPDGTADSVNWETGEFTERVKKVSSADFTWRYQAVNTERCMMVTTDVANIWDDLLYDYQILCSNYEPANGTYNWQAGYILSKHDEIGHTIFIGETLANIGILDEDDEAMRTTKVRAYITAHPFTMQYKYATPQTPIQIKQFGETYGGVVWEYNEKPIQVEDSVCNVFSDKNVKMKFKAVSY